MEMRANSRSVGTFERLKSVVGRYLDFVKMGANYWQAFQLIAEIRMRRTGFYQAVYKGQTIYFRSEDEQALREVLADGEYDFLDAKISELECPRLLDVGCHIGTFSRWVLACNARSNIVAVEADPRTFDLACKNLDQSSDNIRLLNKAAAATDSETLFLSTAGPSMSHRVVECGDVAVQSVSLGKLVSLCGGRVDVAKIDIEGAEEAFVLGSDALDKIDELVIELHPGYCDADAVVNFLKRHYSNIEEVAGRKSSKPLLYCFGKKEESLDG